MERTGEKKCDTNIVFTLDKEDVERILLDYINSNGHSCSSDMGDPSISVEVRPYGGRSDRYAYSFVELMGGIKVSYRHTETVSE